MPISKKASQPDSSAELDVVDVGVDADVDAEQDDKPKKKSGLKK